MKAIDTFDFSDKTAIIRVDFNVPLDSEFNVTDSTRIKAAIPTINKVLSSNGKVVLMSHLGRPKNKESEFSLKHILPTLNELLEKNVKFASDCIGEETKALVADMNNGEIVLLENLRYYSEEKKGDAAFAKKLANLADIYINDAFGTAHRAHASTATIAQFFPKAKLFGYLIEKEMESVSKVIDAGQKPVVGIIGGAKVSSKIGIISHLLDKVDVLLIGGGMAYTFMAAQNGSIGKSLIEPDYYEMARSIIQEAKDKNVRLILPEDSLCSTEFSEKGTLNTFPTDAIEENYMGLDIGPKALERYCNEINNAKTILWNGPMGVFEMETFKKGTVEIALAVASATKTGAFSLVGGGDSVAAINQFNLTDAISHISTGGGAMLEYLEGKQLPGIKAILKEEFQS